jgi:hypothetical protein
MRSKVSCATTLEVEAMKRIYITYDNQKKQDGIGAQLQRIFGLYAISQKFHLGYLHSPILETAEELAHNVTSIQEMQSLLDSVNSQYNFPSDELVEFDEEVYLHNLTITYLVKLLIKSSINRKKVLLRVCLPFGIMDKHPNWYECAGEYLRLNQLVRKSSDKKVVVHVRYGYKPIVGINQSSAPRFLPLSYYSDALKNILKQENLGVDSQILVHTDIPSMSGIWKPFQQTKLSELSSIGYDIQENALNFEGIDLRKEYFSEFPNVEIKYCAPILETLHDLITAGTLLMSRSSFSYIAGIVNENSVYIPRSHGHAKLKRWKWDYKKKESPQINLLSGI